MHGQYSHLDKLITTYPSVDGIVLIATDISERKILEKQLQEKERLAAIGQTASMVGHDIRNPLQAITSDLYLIEEELKSIPVCEGRECIVESVNGIYQNLSYINKIVADLQDYSRHLKPEHVDVNLYELVTAVYQPIDIPKNITPSIDIDCSLFFKSDPTLLKRIFTNLIINAIQAMPEGGRLDISGCPHDNTVLIIVEDTGVGIPEEVKLKLFTPMVTTKSKGQGLGLAVVKRLVEALNGTISFETEVDKGTKFIIELPLAN